MTVKNKLLFRLIKCKKKGSHVHRFKYDLTTFMVTLIGFPWLWQTFVTWLVVVRSVVSVTAFYHNSSPDHKYWMTSDPPLYILSNKALALDIGLRPQSVGYMSDIMEKATAAARSINFGHKCETHLPCPCAMPGGCRNWNFIDTVLLDSCQIFSEFFCMFFPLPYQKKASKQYM